MAHVRLQFIVRNDRDTAAILCIEPWAYDIPMSGKTSATVICGAVDPATPIYLVLQDEYLIVNDCGDHVRVLYDGQEHRYGDAEETQQ